MKDKQDFTEVYEENFLAVYRYLFLRSQDKKDAEDLTSETFLKAFASYHKYAEEEGKPILVWLFRIAHNLFVDSLRKTRVNAEIDEAEDLASEEDIKKNAHQHLLIEEIYKILNQFKPEEKELLLMKIVSDLRFEDIAKILGENINTVKTKYFRSLKKLQKEAEVLMALLLLIS